MSEMENVQKAAGMNEEWCRRMEELAQKQAKYAKGQFILSCISAVARLAIVIAIVVGIVICIPKITEVSEQVNGVVTEAQSMMGELEKAAKSLEALSSQDSDGAPTFNIDLSSVTDAIEELTKAIEAMPKAPTQ